MKEKRTKMQKFGTVLGWTTGFTLYVHFFLFFSGIIKKTTRTFLKMFTDVLDEEVRAKRIENDTWKNAVKRHRATAKKIKALRRYHLRLKRLMLLIPLPISVWCLYMGGVYTHWPTYLMGGLVLLLVLVHILRTSYRVWQIDNRELGSLGLFGNDRFYVRMFHWHNSSTISPSTINFLGFLTVGIGWLSTVSVAMAGAEGVGYYVDLAKGDLSMKFLGDLFGSIGGLWVGEQTALTQAFLVYNTAVMSVGMLFMFWTATQGFIQTSQEGEFLGKRFSSVWLPVRLVVGTTGILPMFGGWSGAQAVMFFATALGIGFANSAWQFASVAIVTTGGGSDYTRQINEFQGVANKELMQNIIRSQMCVIGYNNASGHYNDRVNGDKVDFPDRIKMVEEGNLIATDWVGSTMYALSFGGGDKSTPNELCGKFNYGTPASLAIKGQLKKSVPDAMGGASSSKSKEFDSGDIIKAHTEAIQAMSISLTPLTREWFFDKTPMKPETLQAIGRAYNTSIKASLAKKATSGNNDFARYLKGEGKSWSTAGIVFIKALTVGKQIGNAVGIIEPYYTRPEYVNTPEWKLSNPGIYRAHSAYQGFEKDTLFGEGGEVHDRDREEVDGKSKIVQVIAKVVDINAMKVIVTGLSNGEQNFIFAIVATGKKLTDFAIVALLSIFMGSSAGLWIANGIIQTCFVMFVLPLLMVGLTMAIFIPMVPLMLWFGGIVTYCIIVVEAFVASPLWMLTHFQGEGEGMGQRSAHGYMFLLNLLFRPIIMIIGFVSAWLLTDILGRFLLKTLSMYWELSSTGSFSINPVFTIHSLFWSFLEFLGILVAMTVMANGLVQKLFSMITYLPDVVFAWVGGHFKGMGAGETDSVRGGIVAFAKGAEGAGQSRHGRNEHQRGGQGGKPKPPTDSGSGGGGGSVDRM